MMAGVMDKVTIRRLPDVAPPIPEGGGRIVTPAGELAQIVNGEAYRYLAFLEFHPDPNAPRGNHFHAVKTEHLYIVDGLVRAIYRDLDTDATAEIELGAGDLVACRRAAPTRTWPSITRTRWSSRRRATTRPTRSDTCSPVRWGLTATIG